MSEDKTLKETLREDLEQWIVNLEKVKEGMENQLNDIDDLTEDNIIDALLNMEPPERQTYPNFIYWYNP